MLTCKTCGKEIPSGEFDQFFTQEALENQLCNDCYNQEALKKYKLAKEEYDQHPDWFLSPPEKPRLRN